MMMMAVASTAPDKPAARAKGTVRPSDMPTTMSRTVSEAVAAMQEFGYDLTEYRSKGLAEVSDMEFDVAVTLGCGDDCSCIKAKAWEDWKTPCPKAMPPEQFRAVRDEIGEKVRRLLARL
jgi:arsenate reductase